ncbi:MAG: hypothetical protein ACKV19_25595 [Verrucomicrobiales bacterium]
MTGTGLALGLRNASAQFPRSAVDANYKITNGRIRQDHELIGHYHTAGNPGRAELDDTQEINYPTIMGEILATVYTGVVAQEFIPTWDDPVLALRHAAMTCDV